VKLQLLPSTFTKAGAASARQHLTCYVVDDSVAFDAGSLGMAATDEHRERIRDVVLSHAHLDHTAGLPLFIDDLFATLEKPVTIHATAEVIEVLERDIFNWDVYPRFSELSNDFGAVVRYQDFKPGQDFEVAHLRVTPLNVNHKVPTCGFLISDGGNTIALSGDTAEMNGFWEATNSVEGLSALLIECAFPNDLNHLAGISHHLNPSRLGAELKKFEHDDCPIYVINLKPRYRETVVAELATLGIDRLHLLEVGRVYSF